MRDSSIDPDDAESLAAALERLARRPRSARDLRAPRPRPRAAIHLDPDGARRATCVRRRAARATASRTRPRRRPIERSQSKCASALTPASSAATPPASAVIWRGCSAPGPTDASASRHTFVLYAHETVSTPLRERRAARHSGPAGTAWEQLALPKAARQDRLDVFFAPGYTAPLLLNTPTVVLVHDISFAAHPEWFRWKEGLRRRWLTRWSCQPREARADRFGSRATRNHFALRASGDPRAVHLSGGHFTCAADVAVARRHGAREPVVLFVGSVFNRRHLPDLIRAFKPIATAPSGRAPGNRRRQSHVSARRSCRRSLRRKGSPRGCRFGRTCPTTTSPSCMGSARAFALLSEYEGFGHPPLEALGSGVPSVLLDTDVAREVCGDAALYVAKGDIAGTTAALNSLLFDEDVRHACSRPALRCSRATRGRAPAQRHWRRSRRRHERDLAIVIVSYNTRSDLENCLQSLHDHPPHVSHEIVVVDNASRDGSVEAVRARWPGVTVITLELNVGFASANNAGIRQTESELVLLLNSDTIVPDGAIDRLIAAMRELPGASVVGPRIVDANGQPELSYGRMMTPARRAAAETARASCVAGSHCRD